ncbi:SpoIIE family protein phosphatase [Streptomyces sp. NPDC048411]|uniref:SpoIIE family protein phosphatase n=1 Tax=Streptomyces sp. NPDC048411 TaxID=3157206 RepID=UPI00345447EB
MFLLQLAVVVLLVAATVVALAVQAGRQGTEKARDRTLAVAEAFANSPGIVEALDSRDPTAVLQPRTERAQERSGVDSIVIISTDGIRYTHPDPHKIGKHVVKADPYKQAVRGKTLTDTEVTPLGLSVFAEVPVFRPDGSVAGIVSPEVRVKKVNEAVQGELAIIFGAAGGALALTASGSALVGRRLLHQTRGLGPAEMTRMYEHHDAVLHAVREGVLIIGGDGRLLLANDEASRLLDLPADAEQRQVTDLGLPPGTAELLASGRAATDEVHLAGNRLLAVNVRPVHRHGGSAGSVATLRDTTELRTLTGRVEVARERLQLLYDAGVRIGTTLNVVRTAEELAEMAVPRFADFVTVELLDPILRGEEPTDARTEMRRTAIRGVRTSLPFVPTGELITFAPATPQMQGWESGHAVLEQDLARADRWRAGDPEWARTVLEQGIHSLISVPLQARGVVLGIANFWRSEKESFEEEDLSFTEELVARAAVAIDNARRYTREHTMAVALQRSLLPRGLPKQSALEVAHRYLPAQAGVGGDWFDVIPLPGARVALVVGDVVGHGLHAAATMGRLRTAVHNFSTLDLAPDELLARLDELVAHIDADEAAGEGEGEGVTGATCLYVIYDPVSGVCNIACAGHLGPALIHPDGTVTFPDVPVSPPLGLGGSLPFETAALQLPEGSQLVLYTDGLIENRHQDLDAGLGLLRDVLSHPGRSPEQTCQAVFDALTPERPSDDIALLVARTRLLDAERVADWDVPSDPAAVSQVRADVTDRLETWGLDQVAFTTELIVSELVTNAIRYGTQPIRLRLLHDRNQLICEVADGSSTSPHLRRAVTTDESGRGLFLVAQYAQRWGTRYGTRGKVIWTEQPLHVAAAETGAGLGDNLLDLWPDTEL